MIPLRVSVFALQTPLVAAVHEGFLAEEGLEVSYTRTTSSTEQMQQLIGGEIDIAQTAADNIIGLAAGGNEGARIFSVADLGIDQFAVTRAGVTEWGQLRGGRISVDSATSGYAFVLYRMLADQGIGPDDYEVVPVGGPMRRFELLCSGEVDVGLLNPHLAAGAEAAGGHVLARAADSFPGYPNLTFAASAASLSDRRPELAAFSRAVRRAVRWAHDSANEARATELLARARDCAPEEARALYRSERSLRGRPCPSIAEAEQSLALVADLRERMGGGRSSADGYRDLIEVDLVEEAQAP